MRNILKAEYIKICHTFAKKLSFLAPILTLLLALLLTGGIQKAVPTGAWNWWYSMLLSGMLAVFCHLCIEKEKKINYCTMFSLPVPPKKCWIGKIFFCAFVLLISNSVLFLGTLAGGYFFGTTISPASGICAVLLLTISCLWEIPLSLFLSARFGMFTNIFICITAAVSGAAAFADTQFWWIYPASIPARLMCPVLGIMPNGLPLPANSTLGSCTVILPGIILSILWFVCLTCLTTIWFEKRRA